jgi:hypothetical protein
MDFSGIGAVYLIIFVVVAYVLLLWNRHRAKRRRKSGFYRTSSSVGNVLLEMQKFAHPSVEHVLQQKLDEREDEDDEGGPKDPTEHLRRSLKRIRNGEKIDNLKVFRPPPD